MAKLRKDFDIKENMLMRHTLPAQSLYHSRLADMDVHPVASSASYASQLMIKEKNYEIALKIFNKILPLQDQDPKSPYFGVFPWYMEEPVAQMNPPDFNMANFNAKEMILVMKMEAHAIAEETAEKMKKAILNACECILRRNEGTQYTNIAIMDVLVTVAGGELLGEERFKDYGRKKIKRFMNFIRGHHSVSEYNSPCYSIIAVNDLGTLLKIVEDEETIRVAEEANDFIWKMLSEHFDYESLQLTGPQSRAYHDYVDFSFIKTVGRACGIDFTKHKKFFTYFTHEEAEAFHQEDCHYPTCPKEYIPYFKGEKKVISVRKMVMDGYNYPWFEFAQVATNYKQENFSIGTMNRAEFWNQRRPFLGYIKSAGKDYCFRVKCYHDGFDYSSSDLHCIQDRGRVLGNVNFSTDRGDTHIGLDQIKNASISAEDLRLSFEFIGDPKEIRFNKTKEGADFEINGTRVRINIYLKVFGNEETVDEIIESEDKISYSIVFYRGKRKTIQFTQIEKAFVGFTVEIGTIEGGKLEYDEIGEMIETKWSLSDVVLELHTAQKPVLFRDNLYYDKQMINGRDILKMTFNEF